MNENEKLDEAKYFYSQMVQYQEDVKVFKYNLSAFLAAAHSVMYYARKEARRKRRGLKWYDDWMNSRKVLSYFRDKRDFNIHTAPVAPRKHVKVEITEVLKISESVHIEVRDKHGKLKESRHVEEEPQSKEAPEPSVKSTSRYEFEAWSGEEDVIQLCEKYIQELEKVVSDGVNQGFISG